MLIDNIEELAVLAIVVDEPMMIMVVGLGIDDDNDDDSSAVVVSCIRDEGDIVLVISMIPI